MPSNAGLIALMGSGETSVHGGRLFDQIARRYTPPLQIAILETPAGFELNSARVAGRIADYLSNRLRNYDPVVHVIPARHRGAPLGPDNPEVLVPLLSADLIFMGPGSPTYAVRHLCDTLAWQAVLARLGRGASLVLASAAAIAASQSVLPVYEIYKAGEDPHWRDGLNLLGQYNLRLAIIPHWNNSEGGADLDTSRCFMGRERFGALAAALPADTGVLGIEEHTSVLIDPVRATGKVLGRGGVVVMRSGVERRYADREPFPVAALGPWRDTGESPPMPEVLAAMAELGTAPDETITDELAGLVAERERARQEQAWARADALRGQIEALGWEVRDTPNGAELVRSHR